MQFCQWLWHLHPADGLVCAELCGKKKRFTREVVLSVINSHLTARDSPHAICGRGYQVSFNVNFWDGIVGDTVVGIWQADCSTKSWFSWNWSTGVAWRCACSRETGCFSTTEFQCIVGRYSAVVERNISWKVDWSWRTDCVAYSVSGSNSDGFLPVRSPEGPRLRSPSQNYRRSRGKTSSSCDKGRCQYLQVSSGASCLFCLHIVL